MRAVVLCVVVLCLLGVSAKPGRSDEKPTLAELRQTLPSVWRQYAATMRRFEGTVHDRTVHTARTRPDPNHRIEDARRRVVGYYPMALLETGLERSKRRSVSAVNQDYFFRIRSHDAGLHWQIVELEAIRTPPDVTELVLVDLVDLERHRLAPAVHPGRLIDQDVLCGLFLSDRWLPNILVDPRFALLDIQPAEVDGRHLMRLSFSLIGTESGIDLDESVLFLMPDHHWLISHGHLSSVFWGEDRFRFVIENEYTFSEGLPVIASSELTVHDVTDGEQLNYVRTRAFSLKRTADTSPARFRLSAFGLPEPDFVGRARFSNHAWIAVAGFILLLLCGLYAARRERAERSAAPTDGNKALD